MVHLRIVVPSYQAEHALDLLNNISSVTNLIYLERAAQRPEGDVILCDVAREDASVIISDLKELNVHRDGSIAIEDIDSQISEGATRAAEAAQGMPTDAVVWEEVETRTSENIELSASFLAFMALAMLIAAVGILTDQLILIIGAMVVGPEFGPIAGLSVAAVHRRKDFAKRSFTALAVGFPVGITLTFLFTLGLDATDLIPEGFSQEGHPFTDFISNPDEFSFIVAFLAGMAGVLSLTNAKSGALVGVLISVTTIPAAANIGVAAALGDSSEWVGAMEQLALNMGAIFLACIGTLYLQRLLYLRRRRAHLHHEAREAAGLPMGRSRRAGAAYRGPDAS
ncbi:MAG TPA: DUF389 domain-containing protein [Solirubrobacterales bacterium]|nr:DUF389 domain-containing protein [Solirubrobacterales bacterium]